MPRAIPPANVSGNYLSESGRTATIYICAAIGGFIAAVADVVQKEDASAVSKLTSLSARQIGVPIAPLWILCLLVLLAAALCFVFQPTDRKQSFVVGLGIIAAVMTVTPYKQPVTGAPAKSDIAWDTHGGLLWQAGGAPIQLAEAGVIAIRVVNTTSDENLVTVAMTNRRTGQDFRQRNNVRPFGTIQFQFEGGNDGDLFYFSVEYNGLRTEAQQLTYSEMMSPIVVQIAPDQLSIQNGDANDPTPSYGGVINKLILPKW